MGRVAEEYCDLCDLPLSTCVHGMPKPPPQAAPAPRPRGCGPRRRGPPRRRTRSAPSRAEHGHRSGGVPPAHACASSSWRAASRPRTCSSSSRWRWRRSSRAGPAAHADRRGPLAPVGTLGAQGDDRRGADGGRQAGCRGADRGRSLGRLLNGRRLTKAVPGRAGRPRSLRPAWRRAPGRGRRRTRTCPGRSSSAAAAVEQLHRRVGLRHDLGAVGGLGRCPPLQLPRAPGRPGPASRGTGSPSIRARW